MKRILVVDDMAIYREPIAAVLEQNDFEVSCASNGREALAMLAATPHDLVLLDVHMPEMNGLDTLNAIRQNPSWLKLPVLFLTVVAEKGQVLRACGLGAQGYLLKNQFSLSDMLRRVRQQFESQVGLHSLQAVAAGTLRSRSVAQQPPARRDESNPSQSPSITAALVGSTEWESHREPQAASLAELTPIVSREDLIRVVRQGLELRPLAPVVQTVMAATANANASADDVARAVSQDQALSIRLLRMSNGAVYSRGRPLTSIREAVTRIGIQEVRKLVMTLGAVEQYLGSASEHLDLRCFWEHSLSCGLIAAHIARRRGAANAEEYCLWGLIHDVGRLILLEHAQELYIQVLETADELDLPLEVVERRLLLMDHCDILQDALEQWGFPRDFVAPVVNHHRSDLQMQRLRPTEAEPTTIVALADRLGHALLLGHSGNTSLYPLAALAQSLGLAASVLEEIVNLAPEEVRNARTLLLAQTHDGEWPDWAETLRQRLVQPISVIYAGSSDEIAHEVVFGRLSSPGQHPNLCVLYLEDSAGLSSVMPRVVERETEAGVSVLPLLILLGKGQIDKESPALRGRPRSVLRVPVRIEAILAATNELLSSAARVSP